MTASNGSQMKTATSRSELKFVKQSDKKNIEHRMSQIERARYNHMLRLTASRVYPTLLQRTTD